MRVRQRAYFCIHSDELEPDRISRALGVRADEATLRGSRRSGPPPIPRSHIWSLYSGLPDTVRLDDHFDALLIRLRSISDALGELGTLGTYVARVYVVRYFEPGPEDWKILAERDTQHPGLTVLRGQHPLVGFGLSKELLAELASLQVSIDFDEYGDEYE